MPVSLGFAILQKPAHLALNDALMSHNRRAFLKKMGHSTLGALALPAFSPALCDEVRAHAALLDRRTPQDVARDEDFWYTVQKAYTQSPHFINLESGYYSPAPQEVLEAQLRNITMINETPSFYMRRRQEEDKAAVKQIVGDFAGVSPDEFVICRNTTEALNTVIHGLELEPGDEALMCDREYDSMLAAFRQRSRRHGLKLNIITLPLVPNSQDEIVRIYEAALTPKTKVLLVSHMIYLTGQVLPVRAICDMAHRRGIEVIVDAAHSFAHLDYKIPDLGADYLGTSLHKWLCAPLGSGLLYVRKEKIDRVWPLFGDDTYAADDIRKFEHIGTHPCSTDLTIVNAIRFQEAIGGKRKEERLRFLKTYWVEQVKDLPHITINTPLGADQSCALANVAVAGMTSAEVVDALWDRHRIFTVAVEQGARIAPNLWTRLAHLDALAEALKEMA